MGTVLEAIASALIGWLTKWVFARQQTRAARQAQAATAAQSTYRDRADTTVETDREKTDATLSTMGNRPGQPAADTLQHDLDQADRAAGAADRDVRRT